MLTSHYCPSVISEVQSHPLYSCNIDEMVTQSFGPMAGTYESFDQVPLMSNLQYGFHRQSYVYFGDDAIHGGAVGRDTEAALSHHYAASSRVVAHEQIDRIQRSVTPQWSAPYQQVRLHMTGVRVDHCPVPVVRPAPRVVRFPWMKTTKSHAHQWKAHWAGGFSGDIAL